jgi:hypothetical protein
LVEILRDCKASLRVFRLVSRHWLSAAGSHDLPPLFGVDNTQPLSAFFEDWTEALSEHEEGWDGEECMTHLLDSHGALCSWLLCS